jgi:hypothetical protein
MTSNVRANQRDCSVRRRSASIWPGYFVRQMDSWKPGMKFYALTKKGRKQLEEEVLSWEG